MQQERVRQSNFSCVCFRVRSRRVQLKFSESRPHSIKPGRKRSPGCQEKCFCVTGASFVSQFDAKMRGMPSLHQLEGKEKNLSIKQILKVVMSKIIAYYQRGQKKNKQAGMAEDRYDTNGQCERPCSLSWAWVGRM